LVGGSSQQILRRLQLLYHHAYLDRPRAQIDYYHEGGPQQIVYGLARRGAGRLRRDLNMPFEKMDWSQGRKNVGRLFLEHALMVSDIMVAIECACRSTDGRVRFLPQEALELPPKTSASNQPFRWSVTLSSGQRIGVIPDAVFALEQSDQPADRQRSYFFLEADRGTMPVTRQNSALSSFARKLQAYAATWTQSLHCRRFNLDRFRVLTATTCVERLNHLVDGSELGSDDMKNWECGSCEASEAISMRDIFALHEYFITELKVGAILHWDRLSQALQRLLRAGFGRPDPGARSDRASHTGAFRGTA
jgi:hypothetical protein